MTDECQNCGFHCSQFSNLFYRKLQEDNEKLLQDLSEQIQVSRTKLETLKNTRSSVDQDQLEIFDIKLKKLQEMQCESVLGYEKLLARTSENRKRLEKITGVTTFETIH
jgi:hypothetical protein